MVGEFDDQSAVLRNQTHQGDQPHLAVDIERCGSQKGEHQGAGDGQGYRPGKNDERIAEAFERRSRHQARSPQPSASNLNLYMGFTEQA